MYKKKDMHIRSYDGPDAFYSGTDEEYEEFLKNADVSIERGEEETRPENVESTQRINLNETINLQNVINKFRKTVGDVSHGAKVIKDSVVNKMDSLKAKKAENTEEKTEKPEKPEKQEQSVPDETDNEGKKRDELYDESFSERLAGSVNSSVEKIDRLRSELRGEMEAISDMPERVDDVSVKIETAGRAIDEVAAKLDEITKRISELESRFDDNALAGERNTLSLANDIKSLSDSITGVKQSVGSVARFSDSVFDLKNTQLNTKNAVTSLESAFNRLRKKCVLGVTVLSILSAIIIALQILQMLS